MSLTPEELKVIPDSFVELYQDLEDFIIEDFARRISKVGSVTEGARLETIRAKEFGMSIETIKKEVSKITGISEEKLKDLLEEVAIYSVEKDNNIFTEAGLNEVKIKNNKPLEDIIKAAIKQTKGELYNLTQSLGFAERVNGKVVFKPIAKYYQDSMDLAVMKIKSGATDCNTAIRQSIKKLSDSGLRYVNYASGWTNRLDVAVRRAVMTGANQMSQQLTLQSMEELGADFVETTAHVGARPSHRVWQGKVFCYSGKSNKYPDFVESTGYGTGPGLGGWNCRHSFFPFFPGISTRAYTDEHLDNIDPPPFKYRGKIYTYYQASQHQREIERAIRKTKAELIGYKAAGLETDFTNASIRLKQQEKYYEEFSKVADIPMEKDRLQTLGFNKSVSQKSVWAKKKYDINKFNEFKEILGDGGPKTLEEFKDIRYNKINEWNNIKTFMDSVKSGRIATGSTLNQWNALKKEVNKKILGIVTPNGIKISESSNHLIERIIGDGNKRKGVPVDDIHNALMEPLDIKDIKIDSLGRKSQKFIGGKATVSINPDTGNIIQTNPTSTKLAERLKRRLKNDNSK